MAELPSPPNSLFGVPLSMTVKGAEGLQRYLEDCWHQSVGVPPGHLNRDLHLLDRFFNPIHVGRSVRDALQKIPPSPAPSSEPSFSEQLVLVTANRGRLLTPEGRVVLSCLREANRLGDTVVLDAELVMRAQLVLLELYRSWSRQRLRGVVELVGNERGAPPLLPPGLGVLLLLLVNRSTDSTRAIVVPEPRDPRGASLESAFAAVVSAFADAIAPSKRGRQVSLRSAYAVTEARRRLPSELSSDGSRLFIRNGSEEAVTAFVVEQLRRRDVPADLVASAFDRLVGAYRQNLPVFAQFGAAHERPAETARIKRKLVDALAGR